MELTEKQIGQIMAHAEVGQCISTAHLLIKYFEDVVVKEEKVDEAFKAGYILAVHVVKDMIDIMMDRTDKRAEEFERSAKSAEEAANKICELFDKFVKSTVKKDNKDIRSADFDSDEEFNKWFHSDTDEEDKNE